MAFEMNFKENGDILFGDDLMENSSFSLVSAINHYLDGGTVTNQDNLVTLSTGDAQYFEFMEISGGTWKCIDLSLSYYVIIKASSLTESSFRINNCGLEQFASGKWILFNTSEADREVSRAQIFKTLFDNGASSPLITAATNVIAIRVLDAEDVGKQGYYITFSQLHTSSNGDRVFTFDNTTTNANCSSWSDVRIFPSQAADSFMRWELPSGTVLNTSRSTPGSYEIGTDRSADEKDNPVNGSVEMQDVFAGGNYEAEIVLFANSTLSSIDAQLSVYDFKATGGMPDTTAVSEDDLICKVTTSSLVTLSQSTVSAVIKTLNTLTGTNTLTIEMTFDGGTTWQTATEKELLRGDPGGTDLRLRFTITRESNDEADSVDDYGMYHSG